MIGTGIAMLVSGLAAGAGSVAGAKLQSNASKRASDIQAKAAEQALAFEQQQYAKAQADYNGWLNGPDMMRFGDYARNAGSYTVPPQTSGPSGAFAPPSAGSAPRFSDLMSVGSGATPAAQGARVPLTAPDGTTALVPAAKVQYYRQKWAAMGAR